MKKLLFILAVTSLCNAANAQKKATTINVKASIYCDHCKKCESCGLRLERSVYKVKGIKRVDIDESQKVVTVVYNPRKTNVDAIRLAISKVGFDADDVKANPVAYEQLDECCKRQ
ncbi:MAG: hypothetical protein EOP49_12065 [Sphingobacteriales bacterium]|nr:MAG: hypothetical protein EOP49_12065 [Sphingobacteriales bacterium]